MENCSFLGQGIRLESRPAWKVLLDQPLRKRAEKAALFVAERMHDPEDVRRIALMTKEQHGSKRPWNLALPSAAAQLALFYSHVARCFPDADWQAIAQRYLQLMATNSQRYGVGPPALFGGISGIAFAVQHCSEAGCYYQRTLADLNHALAEEVYTHPVWSTRLKAEKAESDFDLISGASGVLGYLTSLPSPDQTAQEIRSLLLEYLLELTEPEQYLGQERWFCPPTSLHSQEQQRFPQGRFNCGLAHGIPGPLAALALTALGGYTHQDLHASLTYVSQWLLDHQIKDTWGMTWPVAIPYAFALSSEQWSTLPTARTAWCYGAPGIAHSLWLAGQVLKDEHLLHSALEALKAALRRPVALRHIPAPTLCHGQAGLLLICLHFAQTCADPFLLEQISLLVEQILLQFDAQNPLGFYDIEPGGVLVNKLDLLNGAPGTALALLAASTPVAPSWDRLLLLS